MHDFKKIYLPSLTFVGLIALAGCPSDDTGGTGDGTDTDPTTTTMTTTMTTTVDTTATTGTDTATGTATGTTTGDTDTDTEGDTDTTGPDPDAFDFREDDPGAYTQVDRMGMPAVNTAVITDKDEYNADVPTSDVAAVYLDQIAGALDLLHVGTGVAGNGLNDDLTGAGLPVCVHPSSAAVGDECVRQGGPFIIPDVLTIDTTAAAGFPNGRQLEDRVMDIILALVLLDVDDAQLDPTPDPDPNGVPLTVLFDLDPATEGDQPLNPAANDVDFLADFPYVAPPHEP